MSLCLIPKVLDSIYVIMLVRKQFTMINSVVFKPGYIQGIIASKGIRINNAVRFQFLPDNWN